MIRTDKKIQISHILKGIVITILLTFVFGGIVAWGIVQEYIPLQYIKWGCAAILFFSTAAGSLFATTQKNEGLLFTGIMHSGMCILLIIGCNIIFWDGRFYNTTLVVSAIILGNISSCGLSVFIEKKLKGQKMKKRYR